MIIVLFGQPACGKTTLAKKIAENDFIHIDGDDLRDIFKNKDYSREGRIKNLNRASDIAKYLSYKGSNVVLSLVYPYEEARKYFDSLTKVKWIYLIYQEDRGRNQFKVEDFELPNRDDIDLMINTSNTSEKDSIEQIKRICRIF